MSKKLGMWIASLSMLASAGAEEIAYSKHVVPQNDEDKKVDFFQFDANILYGRSMSGLPLAPKSVFGFRLAGSATLRDKIVSARWTYMPSTTTTVSVTGGNGTAYTWREIQFDSLSNATVTATASHSLNMMDLLLQTPACMLTQSINFAPYVGMRYFHFNRNLVQSATGRDSVSLKTRMALYGPFFGMNLDYLFNKYVRVYTTLALGMLGGSSSASATTLPSQPGNSLAVKPLYSPWYEMRIGLLDKIYSNDDLFVAWHFFYEIFVLQQTNSNSWAAIATPDVTNQFFGLGAIMHF